ncbi:uncharacterized protein EI90DRAFT_3156249 [Cantharellus anzutake]|uniref:uncharacterized protein n=1 Tax=Cantharellus anzutake TaxID=1750568 RepID=UPI0019083FFE|nr:uncharacterized protein EI90DRAFT_3156249 [Cantharellus anzutake]KAF8327155.1 hypothetical protein EI90DRAFT_3156249 [Cantharellus anzutake]
MAGSKDDGSFDQLFIHPRTGVSYAVFQQKSTKPMLRRDKDLMTSFDLSWARDPSGKLGPLTSQCLNDHFEHGETSCFSNTGPKMDVVWTWVNGSDPLIRNDMIEKAKVYHLNPYHRKQNHGMKTNQYRDHNELQYSMRSAYDHFQSQTRNLYIVSTDVEAPVCHKNGSVERWRLGQLPSSIRQNSRIFSWNGSQHELHVFHHGQIFTQPNGSNYNSLAIESQLYNIPNLSEYFIYMNDDTFFLSNFETLDFYTDAFGIIVRMQSDLLVSPHKSPGRGSDEWKGLEFSNSLLSGKFGERWRPYGSHHVKVLSTPLLNEISLIWSSEILHTAAQPFRSILNSEGDFYIMWLFSHFVVERWREALLWSWVVGKVGKKDGGWDEECAARAWKEVGGQEGEAKLGVLKGKRETLKKEKIEDIRNDENFPPKTKFAFAAFDGYPYAGFGRRGAMSWFSSKQFYDPSERCVLEFNDCLAPVHDGQKLRSEGVFKRVAFERAQSCGDCIITALVKASGPLGLSAFLPPTNRTFETSRIILSDGDQRTSHVPMLPLTKRWNICDYSLENVLAPYASSQEHINIRQWILRLLLRYRFVIGVTPSSFRRLKNPQQARSVLSLIPDRDDPQAGLLCLNDNVGFGDLIVGNIMAEWMAERWWTPSPWELD